MLPALAAVYESISEGSAVGALGFWYIAWWCVEPIILTGVPTTPYLFSSFRENATSITSTMLRAVLWSGRPAPAAASRIRRRVVSLSTYSSVVSSRTDEDEDAPSATDAPLLAARPGSQQEALKSLVDSLLAKQTFVPAAGAFEQDHWEPAWKGTSTSRSYHETQEQGDTSVPKLAVSATTVLAVETAEVGVQGSESTLTSVTTKSYSSAASIQQDKEDTLLFTPYEEEIDFEDGELEQSLDTSRPPTTTTAGAVVNPSIPSPPPDTEETEEEAAAKLVEPQQQEEDTSVVVAPRKRQHPLIETVDRYVRYRNVQQAMTAFYDLMRVIRQAKQSGQEPPQPGCGLIKGLYRIVCPRSRRPFDAHQILQYYMTFPDALEYLGDGVVDGYAAMYNRLCDSMRHMDPEKHTLRDIENLVRTVSAMIRRMDRSGQELCCPTLVSALLEQRSVQIGYDFTEPIYKYILKENFDVPDGWFVHLLSHSRYNRQDDLPFADVLARAVSRGRHPPPVVVIHALDNFFPFTDIESVSSMLKSILQLQQEVVEAAKSEGVPVRPKDQYLVDIGTLEMIGAAAASQGSTDINLLIWDMLDVLGYQPTVGIYENTVVAFSMNTFTYKEAFTVLAEMESSGFVPSRALIRSVSTHLR